MADGAWSVTSGRMSRVRAGQRATLFAILAFGVALGLIGAYGIRNFHVMAHTVSVRDRPAGLLPGKAVVVTPTQLSWYERSVGHDVYWLGPRAGFTYELTETAAHDTYLRYLPAGVPVGSRRPDYTAVGTYPAVNAYAALGADARDKGQVMKSVSYSGLASWSVRHPTSVYLAYPRLPYLIEIYNPVAATARSLALSGALEPVRAGY
jgi:hypothetical protein